MFHFINITEKKGMTAIWRCFDQLGYLMMMGSLNNEPHTWDVRCISFLATEVWDTINYQLYLNFELHNFILGLYWGSFADSQIRIILIYAIIGLGKAPQFIYCHLLTVRGLWQKIGESIIRALSIFTLTGCRKNLLWTEEKNRAASDEMFRNFYMDIIKMCNRKRWATGLGWCHNNKRLT